jgi:excisionase family DNA binding protein
MAQALDPIDTVLAELRHDIGNTLCVINIVLALQRNRSQLLPLLHDMLGQLSQHIEVSLPTIPAELTTQQAADLLNVSRLHLVRLLTERKIPHRKVGTHRRVVIEDLMAYKKRIDTARDKALSNEPVLRRSLGTEVDDDTMLTPDGAMVVPTISC